MIISHKYKFIFIKTNKTAGTSLEIALSKFCGVDDIITPITQEDEMIRNQFGCPSPQNYLGENSFYNHISAMEVKNFIKKEQWDTYFKFCFERNPWDRCVSLYYWLYKNEPRPKFSNFIYSNELFRLKKKGFELYTNNNQVIVDNIFLYEELEHSLAEIQKYLRLPEEINLPKAKAHFRKNKAGYRDYFSTKSEKARVAELFNYEISSFGYVF